MKTICGPKLSICCTLLSTWGLVMLVSILGRLGLVYSLNTFLTLGRQDWASNEVCNASKDIRLMFFLMIAVMTVSLICSAV